jgi:hypothetical protein
VCDALSDVTAAVQVLVRYAALQTFTPQRANSSIPIGQSIAWPKHEGRNCECARDVPAYLKAKKEAEEAAKAAREGLAQRKRVRLP